MKQSLLFAVLILIGHSAARAQLPDADLQQVSARELAAAARELGDAARGAVVFFQPHMACSKCHAVVKAVASSLGPDLTTLGKEATDESLVESVLLPSKGLTHTLGASSFCKTLRLCMSYRSSVRNVPMTKKAPSPLL